MGDSGSETVEGGELSETTTVPDGPNENIGDSGPIDDNDEKVETKEKTSLPPSSPTKKPFERLSTIVKPSKYILTLKPNLLNFTFEGDVTIVVDVTGKTNKIKVNSDGLTIQAISFNSSKGSTSPSDFKLIPDEEILEITFGQPLELGEGRLDVKYAGILNDNLYGFYRSKFKDENGQDCHCACTHFEPTSARKCFPCWDEPLFKAYFDVTLVTSKNLVALSNMPCKQTTDEGDLKRHEFEATPLMSTYLIAVFAGDYAYAEGKTKEGVVIRGYCRKPILDQAPLSVEIACKCVNFYNEYFTLDYPLPKMDLVGLADFAIGAMENWGLVTFREDLLFIDPQQTLTRRRMYSYQVIAHEISHMWFGNLVTMQWWTHLWLKEGFAAFMQVLSIDHLYPDLDCWSDFIPTSYILALELDSLKSSHPIEVEVGHPSEVSAIFDTISYKKGASILRMLHHYIGDCNFRRGLFMYLTKHKYGNTVTEHLWKALEVSSRKPITKVMPTWTEQMGYPVLTVYAVGQDDGVLLKIRQNRFLRCGDPGPSQLWFIPIQVSCSTSSGKEAAEMLLETAEEELFVPGADPNGWIKVNAKQFGFFRVIYSEDMLENLKKAAESKEMHPHDRAMLVDDLIALCQAGYFNSPDFLKFVKVLKDEDEMMVWIVILKALAKLNLILSGSGCEKDFQNFQKNLLSTIWEKIGPEPKPDEQIACGILREKLVLKMADLDNANLIEYSTQIFLRQQENSDVVISPDVRPAVYISLVRSDFPNIIDKLYSIYDATNHNDEKFSILRSFASAKNPAVVQQMLEFIKTDRVRIQDKSTAFQIVNVMGGQRGGEMSFKFMMENEQFFRETFLKAGGMGYYINSYQDAFHTREDAKRFADYFNQHPFEGTEMSVKQTVEAIECTAEWFERDYPLIDNYFHACHCLQNNQ